MSNFHTRAQRNWSFTHLFFRISMISGAPWPDRADANLAKEQLTSLMQFAQDLSEWTNWDENVA